MKSLSRRDRIVFLLEHWPDYFEVAGRDGNGSDGAGPMLPRMSRHPSVVELNRCLKQLRAEHSRTHAHLMGFYTCEWRTVNALRPVKKGKPTLGAARIRQRVVPPWIRRPVVDDGVDLVVGMFRGEPFIPNELMELVA